MYTILIMVVAGALIGFFIEKEGYFLRLINALGFLMIGLIVGIIISYLIPPDFHESRSEFKLVDLNNDNIFFTKKQLKKECKFVFLCEKEKSSFVKEVDCSIVSFGKTKSYAKLIEFKSENKNHFSVKRKPTKYMVFLPNLK